MYNIFVLTVCFNDLDSNIIYIIWPIWSSFAAFFNYFQRNRGP